MPALSSLLEIPEPEGLLFNRSHNRHGGIRNMSADGTWNVTMNTPMGAQAGTLTFATDVGTLTGTMSGAQGSLDLEDGTIDGDALSWTVNMTSPMPIKVESTATITGDEINGEAKLGAFGTATFSGTRA
jgi:hypothetical protein